MRIVSLAVVLALGPAVAAGKPDGTCGYQCTRDSECGECGAAGKCSCPNGADVPFAETSCTCVSSPTNPPKVPAADVGDSLWPQQWTADVEAWCYGDFSNKSSVAKGKFYYDAKLGKTRADWSPYINGKDAKQVWIGDESGKSTYFVKSGFLCLQFPITDPGQGGAPVGVERPDWMQNCQKTGFATYVGREQVRVDNKDVWVDHWSCRLDYKAVNQSITFQNWHSLGLDHVVKGLPLRVTGGNSAPNPTKGSPRLNSVWYSNFNVSSTATNPDDFVKPNWGICIPVGASEAEKFFGHQLTLAHTLTPAFHRRAHFFPHATPSSKDLSRAKRRQPGAGASGGAFGEAMRKLNTALRREQDLRLQSCHETPLETLHEMQRLLFEARSPELDQVYIEVGDTRRMAHLSLEALEQEQALLRRLEGTAPDLFAKARDGVCHEMVMWYIHHLSASARDLVKDTLVLPLLPEKQHPEPASDADMQARRVHNRYDAQVSCAICHVTPKHTAQLIAV